MSDSNSISSEFVAQPKYFTQPTPSYNPPDHPNPTSPISPHPFEIPHLLPPPRQFSWPERVTKYLDELIDNQHFIHRPRVFNPYFLFNGLSYHQGREVFEVYAVNLPKHPFNPQPFPNFTNFFNTIAQSLHPTQSPAPTSIASAEDKHPQPPDLDESNSAAVLPKYAKHSVFPTENDSVTVVSLFHGGVYSAGPPSVCHGGQIASFVDTVMYECVLQSDRKAVTGGLTISYKAPTPINTVIIAVATVELLTDRKANARIALFSEDFNTLLAEATAVFITPVAWVGMKEELSYSGDATKNTKF